jgi:hypothetical protein
MLECSRFLEGYSAFRDGELEKWESEVYEAHLRSCPSCARYDRIIDRGVQLYRENCELAPSDDFLPRLQHRLYHVDEELRGAGRSGSGASAALTLGISAIIAAMAWVPALRTEPAVLELPPVAARAPVAPLAEPGLLFHRGPFLVREPLPRTEMGTMFGDPMARDNFFRYSPVGSQNHVRSVSQY